MPKREPRPRVDHGSRLARSSRRLALPLLIPLNVASSAFAQTAPAAPTGRLIAKAGTELEARADGTACAPRVKVVITSADPKQFEGDIPLAARFFSNARAGHSLSCPQMTRMVAQGKSNGRVMFTAMADQGNAWEALILGSTVLDNRAEDAALAGSGPTPKSVFRSGATFVPAQTVLMQTKDKYLCLAGATLACEVVLKFTPSGADKTTIAYRQALSGGKAAAAVTTTAENRDGFFCGDPTTATAVVEDPQMSEDARKDYAEQLLERVKSNGEICTGFSGKGDAMTAYGFDGTGKSVDKARAVTLSAGLPAFTGVK
ncbi:MAG: hypothetical protein JWQ11_2672 [Rhizobacter sp.]|nr:hypothetical protein [Rhizobacter sp.]